MLIKAQQSFNYQHSECIITKIEWVSRSDDQKLDLEYTYSFQGQTFKVTNYVWGLNLFSNQNRMGAQEFFKRAKVGEPHGCFFDTKDPQNSVINVGLAVKNYELWILVLFLLLFGWGFFLSWFFPKYAEETFVSSDPS